MATGTVEERLSAMETELEKLKRRIGEEKNTGSLDIPWWKKIVGKYKDDPEYDEAMRLGREYRESQRMEYDEEPA